jgi:hypothetical protein
MSFVDRNPEWLLQIGAVDLYARRPTDVRRRASLHSALNELQLSILRSVELYRRDAEHPLLLLNATDGVQPSWGSRRSIVLGAPSKNILERL